MSGVKINSVLAGAPQLLRAIKLADPKTKARVVAVIKRDTQVVAGKAKSLAPRVTGEMADTIRDEYSADGMVGYVKVGFGKLPRRSKAQTAKGQARAAVRHRKIGKGAYAPVVDRGDPRRGHKASHFLSGPYAAEQPVVVKDLNAAMNDSMNDIASEAHP